MPTLWTPLPSYLRLGALNNVRWSRKLFREHQDDLLSDLTVGSRGLVWIGFEQLSNKFFRQRFG